MFAVIQASGKQVRVEVGQTISVDLISEQEGDDVVFNEVLLIEDDGKVQIGKPFVENARVTATYMKETKDKKIIVFRKKRRKDVRVKTGHRQHYSLVRISKIEIG